MNRLPHTFGKILRGLEPEDRAAMLEMQDRDGWTPRQLVDGLTRLVPDGEHKVFKECIIATEPQAVSSTPSTTEPDVPASSQSTQYGNPAQTHSPITPTDVGHPGDGFRPQL